ncbi:MAG: SIR2 family protein [Actinomycetota bacterium]|nr:SIR2 family protein [Actinomycetota bacterium]
MSAFEQLAEHLGSFRSAPFLFVGAGLSRRYLGLETWSGVLEKFAATTGKPYAYYVTSGNSDLTKVASVLADTFHEVWWNADDFEASREQYAQTGLRNRESPLKVEIAGHTREAMNNLPTEGELAEELELLGEAVIDGVITTNFDPLLEAIFDDHRVYVGQDQLLFSDPQGVGEIYKIHGSYDDPDSLVLTEADFERYRDRNPYLAAKLLTVFVEHPVLFLGYSLSDPNVQQILVSVARCLTTENLERLQHRLIFIRWDPDVSTPTFVRSVMSIEGFTIPVVTVTVEEFAGVFRVLSRLHRKFPARLLRQLKEHIYELVLSNEPSGRLFVQDIDADTNLNEIDVVFGVGVQDRLSSVGYVGVSRRDVLLDILRPESAFDPARMAGDALPVLIQRHPTAQIPMYRYLRGAGLLNDSGALVDGAQVDDAIRKRVAEGLDRLLPPEGTRDRCRRVLTAASGTLAGLIEKEDLHDILAAATMIPRDQLDLEELREFLDDHADAIDSGATSSWARLVCVYDYHAYSVITSPLADPS